MRPWQPGQKLRMQLKSRQSGSSRSRETGSSAVRRQRSRLHGPADSLRALCPTLSPRTPSWARANARHAPLPWSAGSLWQVRACYLRKRTCTSQQFAFSFCARKACPQHAVFASHQAMMISIGIIPGGVWSASTSQGIVPPGTAVQELLEFCAQNPQGASQPLPPTALTPAAADRF